MDNRKPFDNRRIEFFDGGQLAKGSITGPYFSQMDIQTIILYYLDDRINEELKLRTVGHDCILIHKRYVTLLDGYNIHLCRSIAESSFDLDGVIN